jgi:hypothetical protein
VVKVILQGELVVAEVQVELVQGVMILLLLT